MNTLALWLRDVQIVCEDICLENWHRLLNQVKCIMKNATDLFFFFKFPTHIQTKVPGNLKSGSVRIYVCIFIHVVGNFVFVLEGPRWRRQEFL